MIQIFDFAYKGNDVSWAIKNGEKLVVLSLRVLARLPSNTTQSREDIEVILI